MLAIASRPGTCKVCLQPIVSGELIRRDDPRDVWVHARCHDASRVARHRQRPPRSPRVRRELPDAAEHSRRHGEPGRTLTD